LAKDNERIELCSPSTFERMDLMGIERIIGRKEECMRLRACLERNEAQLIIIYGRRRVGKTFLINEYFDKRFAF
jgi:predicted AAA+ superfamily ATPase